MLLRRVRLSEQYLIRVSTLVDVRHVPMTLLIEVVLVIGNVTCLVGDRIANNTMEKDVPDAGASTFSLDCPFNLICSRGYTPPKVCWE